MSELRRIVYTATLRDGSQLMVEHWVDEYGVTAKMMAATRSSADRSEVWGPPSELLLDAD